MDGNSKSKCSFSNVAGKGSRQHDFCTTEQAIFDSSEFEVGEKNAKLTINGGNVQGGKEFRNF